MQNTWNTAEKLGLRALMNSFLRDYSESPRVRFSQNRVLITISEEDYFQVEVASFSLVGAHRYTGPILHVVSNDPVTVSLSFFAAKLANAFGERDPQEFLAYFDNSVSNIQRSLCTKNPQELSTYLRSEKSLVAGHPFHPFPKCKWGASASDLRTYAPEFEGLFNLCWVRVEDAQLFTNRPEALLQLRALCSFDLPNAGSDELWIPLHPWQLQHTLEKRPVLHALLLEQREGSHSWAALSSMRSLYHPQAPLQLKFSLSLKLTNSLRLLQQAELERGYQLHQLEVSGKLNYQSEHFYIQHEPYYFGLKNANGEIISELLVQLRQPLPESTDLEQTVLAGALVEEGVLPEMISQLGPELALARKNWFRSYLDRVIIHFLELYRSNGVLLGAHLQNVLVRFKDGMPIGAIYRDAQGVGLLHSDSGQSAMPVLSDAEVNKVFGYYLIVNHVFGIISAIAVADAGVERALLSELRLFLREQVSPSAPFIDFLLTSDHLYQKGNFRCSLLGLDEATAAAPWQIYNRIPNPLVTELRKFTPPPSTYQHRNSRGQRLEFSLYQHQRDLDLLHGWHQKRFVSEFWELAVKKEELQTHMQRLLDNPSVLPLIFSIEGQPVGYFECYWAFEDRIAPYCDPHPYDRGIHLLIGEEAFLDGQTAYDGILHVTHFLFQQDSRTQHVWGEPRRDNRRILQLARRLPGWGFVREFEFPHKKANLLCCPRDKFYLELDHEL